jgi:sugar phosphate isomerase/epimerase
MRFIASRAPGAGKIFKPTDAMKFSCADFTFSLLPHDGALQLIKLLGIGAVDLGFFSERSHLQPEHVRGNVAGAAKAFRARLDELGLELADVFLQTNEHPVGLPANHPDPAVREQTREFMKLTIEFAVHAGARHITGLPGVSHPGIRDGDSLSRSAEESSWRAAEAAKAGLVYAVEAHVGSICPSPETTLEFLRQASNVTLTLDYGHFIYQGMSNESVHPLLPHASHFHARGGAPRQLQSTVKENMIDFAAILREFRRLNYQGYICLEYVWVDWEGCNRTDNVSETLLLKDFLNQLIESKA